MSKKSGFFIIRLRGLEFSISELNYLLRHEHSLNEGVAPLEEDMVNFLVEMRKVLIQVNNENLDEQNQKNLITQKLFQELGLETSIKEKILNEWVNSTNDNNKFSIDDFLGLPGIVIDDGMSTEELKDPLKTQFNTYILLSKIAHIFKKLKVTFNEATFIFGPGSAVGWYDLRELPFIKQDPAQRFADWEKMIKVFQLRDDLPSGDLKLIDILNPTLGGNYDSFLQKLSELTGWNQQEINTLVGINGLNLTFPNHYKDGIALIRIKTCFDILKRLGVSSSRLIAWKADNATDVMAQDIKKTVKAKYDEERWQTIARPLRDELREKQRTALVSYLIGNQGFTDEHDLYSNYLIDVEMDPCMLTSRIKQALCSVQLFVTRCLMNLEQEQNGSPVEADWSILWEWMKQYRVWEANQKVFFYPENWIFPELRDDKTPFFKELEEELMQNEITAETAETAFLHYLEKLDTVAHLEPSGMFHEREVDDAKVVVKDIIHVIGRTREEPHEYYYRQKVNSNGSDYWTPWEKVEVDIGGDHLVPITFNRRLYLFWPIFKEKSKEKITGFNNPSAPEKYWEIQLAWSEYKNNFWSAKKVSKEFLSTDKCWEKHSLMFKGQYSDDESEIIISCYRNYNVNELTKIGEFQLNGCNKYIKATKRSGTIYIPFNFNVYNNKFTKDYSPIYIPQARISGIESEGLFYNADVLSKFPYSWPRHPFYFLPPHQENYFASQRPFFCGDKLRSFFIEPEKRTTRFKKELFPGNDNSVTVEPIDGFVYDYFRVTEYFPIEPFYPPETFDIPVFELEASEPSYIVNEYAFNTKLMQLNEMYSSQTPVKMLKANKSSAMKNSLNSNRTYVVSYETSVIRSSQNIEVANPYYGQVELLPPVVLPSSYYVYLDAKKYNFITFYHPYAAEFTKILNRDGIEGLLQRPVQRKSSRVTRWNWRSNPSQSEIEYLNSGATGALPHSLASLFSNIDGIADSSQCQIHVVIENEHWLVHYTYFDYTFHIRVEYDTKNERYEFVVYKEFFEYEYAPFHVDDLWVIRPFPVENVDFDSDGSYSIYNWEIFFHAPLLIADRLSKNQKFEDAYKWFHYIFNPTDCSPFPIPQRYWQFLPFHNLYDFYETNGLTMIMRDLIILLYKDNLTEEENKIKEQLLAQIAQWEQNPFEPHLLARMRVIPYLKTTVMKYIDNLIAWADQLFRRDTIETINEATQLYILAAEILGRRPVKIVSQENISIYTYHQLITTPNNNSSQDDAVDPLNEIENLIPETEAEIGDTTTMANAPLPTFNLDVFCLPHNDKLFQYWDIVEDRLFKIRHCMNIEGVVRQLPLYEPPIDPGLLVRAKAAGVDIYSALNEINVVLPQYRFPFLLQKAMEFCNDVKNLGSIFLSTLEKRDVEDLSLLRQKHEINLLKEIMQIKKQLVKEAKNSLESLRACLKTRSMESWHVLISLAA